MSQISQIKQLLKEGKAPDFTIPGWPEDKPLFDYQRCGVAWLFLTPKALLLDQTGVGKTSQCLGLLQYLKSKGELSTKRRALIIVPAISVYGSWAADGFNTFVPDMKFVIGRGTKKQREKIYADPSYEVLLTNFEIVRTDINLLSQYDFDIVIIDEAEYVRNPKTKTHQAVKILTENASRVVGATATPIQTNLMDLQGLISVVGLEEVLGTAEQFQKEYYKTKMIKVRTGSYSGWTKKFLGYHNTGRLKQRLNPYYIRRTYSDISVETPELTSHTIKVELTERQKEVYREIQSGFVNLGPDSNPLEIKAAALKLRQVCTSTAAIFDDEDSSAKMDKLMHLLHGDWQGQKIVLFSNWKSTIEAMRKRLEIAGIGNTVITGDQNNQVLREEQRQRFWNDPKCQVLLGTTAIERSLNLQCARIQVNLDLLYNASRHGQLAGRINRIGSLHHSVFVFSFIAVGTIEEGIVNVLKQRQGLSDHILDEESLIFEALTIKELLKLIGENHGLGDNYTMENVPSTRRDK